MTKHVAPQLITPLEAETFTSKRVVDVLDPEVCLVGALLHHSTEVVYRVLDGITDEDFSNLKARQVVKALRELVTTLPADTSPDPAVLMSYLRERGRFDSDHHQKAVAAFVLDAHEHVPEPGNVDQYRRNVLASALCQVVATCGAQLLNVAESGNLTDTAPAFELAQRHYRATLERFHHAGGVLL